MTKILTNKCSIPCKSGEYKEAKVEFDLIWAINMDIDIFNFVDVVLRKLRMGKLYDEMMKKEREKSERLDGDHDEDGLEDKDLTASYEMIHDEEDDATKKVDGIWPIKIGPDGIPLLRNPSDVMSNFYITYVVRAFTDIDDVLQNLQNNGEQKRIQRFTKEIDRRKENWDNEVVQTFNEQAIKYNDLITRSLWGAGAEDEVTPGEEDAFSEGRVKSPTGSTTSDGEQQDSAAGSEDSKGKLGQRGH